MKEYFSELYEYLPDFVICEEPEERVPALKGQRLQLDSLPPLLICLIKHIKHDVKKGTRTKIRSHLEFPLVRKNDSIPFIVYLFSANMSLLLWCLDFKKIIPKEYPESFDPVSVDSVYDLRFIVIHVGKKFQEGHYYGFFETLLLTDVGN